MKDLKIDLINILHNEDKKQEAVWMLNKIGYKTGYKSVNFYRYLYACGNGHEQHQKTIQFGNNAKTFRKSNFKEITLAELRAMVNPMKEYLMPSRNYEYILTDAREALEPHAKDWVSIPEGANYAYKDELNVHFTKLEMGYRDLALIWVRPAQPEALPFIDDNPQSLCEQYAEIEKVRQAIKDNVNHPSHYTKGKVECLDALESATIGKSGIEAVCVANIIKYLWRYEEKNGVEDVRKAQFYLNRLLATLENNNG